MTNLITEIINTESCREIHYIQDLYYQSNFEVISQNMMAFGKPGSFVTATDGKVYFVQLRNKQGFFCKSVLEVENKPGIIFLERSSIYIENSQVAEWCL